jgi:hypothetical protein
MKRKSFKLGLITLALLGMFVSGCRKTSTEETTQSAEDQSLAEGTYNDVHRIADEGATGSLSSYKVEDGTSMLSACATVTNDTSSSPHRLTIDFGSTNCLCMDGRYRRGKIYCDYSGRYRDSLSTHTISFDNYYVDDNKIEGTKTVTNMGRNSAGNLTYSIHVAGSIIKADGSGTISWTSDRTREWVAGEGTSTRYDDVYHITGSASGTSAAGVSYTATITTPLEVALDCRWIRSGTVSFTPGTKPTRIIDYGTGACDRVATVTVSGRTYNITLH